MPARTKPGRSARPGRSMEPTADWRSGGIPLSCAPVTSLTCTHVEVYVFRRRAGRVEFLALRRAPGRNLGGVWQPVTGRLEFGESAVRGAAREVLEETGFTPLRWWALESMTLYFDALLDRVVVLPLFAAEVPAGSRVEISDEHDRARFVPRTTAARLFLWDAQRTGLDAVARQVLRGGARARALEITARPRGRTRRRPAHQV
jgi:dihydroneopterin triphosphate diphosphatase